MTWVILGSGPSLNIEDVEYVRDKAKVIAVSNSYELAPWAEALVSHDARWWQGYLEAKSFQGKKYCRQTVPGTEKFIPSIMNGCNSGYMAMEVAQSLGAERIILLGFDMQGSHFFGPHDREVSGYALKNTSEVRFKMHLKQFKNWKGCPVFNCTIPSRLTDFSFANLRDIL